MSYPIQREELGQLLSRFARSAFRLETLDQYLVPSEAEEFSRFKIGDELPKSSESEWTKLVQKNVGAGKTMQRVHAISLPLSTYLKYEIDWGYVYSSVAGEGIYIVDRSNLPSEISAIQDFWLFDDKVLITMQYDSDGSFLHPEKEDAPEIVASYSQLSVKLLSVATPLKSFLARRRTT